MTKKFQEDRELERNLILQFQNGDQENAKEAMERLLEYHKGLIYSLAYKFIFLFPTETIDDLTQEFSIFFIRCVEKYDPENIFGAKLSTYFRKAIFLNVWGLHNQKRSLIVIPKHICLEAVKILKIEKELLKEIGEPATDEQVYEKLGIRKELGESFKNIFNAYYVSLESPTSNYDDRPIEEMLADSIDHERNNLEKIFNGEAMEKILFSLSKTSPTIQVFVKKFLSGMPQEKIISELRLSYDEVERIWRTLRNLPKRDKIILELKKSILSS